MRVYLDQSVIQDIKRDTSGELFTLISRDATLNIYCYSEAHLYDLRRDKTPEKFKDMDLLESLTAEHCFVFEDGNVQFLPLTPKEYYARFDWDTVTDITDDLMPLSSIYLQSLKLIPFNLGSLITGRELPEDMPADMRVLLYETATYYDFFICFLNMSQEITSQQKKFRSLLQYLHANSFIGAAFEQAGITGFNGQHITDREKFFESYTAFCAKLTKTDNVYSAFLIWYFCLELLGIVKGKPQKQKMPNLTNDGRHAYFATYCDFIVSSDDDFIRKASFLYDAVGIYPKVMNLEEYREWLSHPPYDNDDLNGLLNNIGSVTESDLCDEREAEDGTSYTTYWLPHYYYHYFNVLTIGRKDGIVFFYFSCHHLRCSGGTFVEEINRVTALLTRDLGEDHYQKGAFTQAEKDQDKYDGRAWVYEGLVVELLLNGGLQLTFNHINDLVTPNSHNINGDALA